MKTLARSLLLLVLLALLAFCGFGFLASAEVAEPVRFKWRLIYTCAGLALMCGMVATAKGFNNKGD